MRAKPFLPKFFRGFVRKTAVVLPKDAGIIIAFAFLGKNDVVVEIGGGNGFLTAYLANICKKVYCYERRKDIFEILRKNIKGFSNVELINKDGIEAKQSADVYVIDSPEAHKIIENVKQNIKRVAVAYLPNIEQVKLFYDACINAGFSSVRVFTSNTVEWEVGNTKPKHVQLVHSAFLVFAFV